VADADEVWGVISAAFSTLALASAIAATNVDAGALTCNLVVPGRPNFAFSGEFAEVGLTSNLEELIGRGEGLELPFIDAGDLIVTDGTVHKSWTSSQIDGERFIVALTEYGSSVAMLQVHHLKFVGRHHNLGLVGVGLCDVQRSNEESQA
jgi:hypothetical protein